MHALCCCTIVYMCVCVCSVGEETLMDTAWGLPSSGVATKGGTAARSILFACGEEYGAVACHHPVGLQSGEGALSNIVALSSFAPKLVPVAGLWVESVCCSSLAHIGADELWISHLSGCSFTLPG